MGSPQDFGAMLALFYGALRPVVDHVYPLRDATVAFRRLEHSDQFGKIVLSVG